jgi:hypothetical protein
MRTTITLDDRLARRLQDEMQARGTSFRQTLESVLEQGLGKRSGGGQGKAFRVQSRPMKLRPGIDPTRLQDLDTDLEVERFHKVTREQEKNR